MKFKKICIISLCIKKYIYETDTLSVAIFLQSVSNGFFLGGGGEIQHHSLNYAEGNINSSEKKKSNQYNQSPLDIIDLIFACMETKQLLSRKYFIFQKLFLQ